MVSANDSVDGPTEVTGEPFRRIWYPAAPTLSVLPDHVRSTSAQLFAAAEVSVGVLGGWVSCAAVTVTVTFAVALPALLVAVKVYVVVCAGLTVVEVVPLTVPTPLLIEMLDAPPALQERVDDCPLTILAGLAVNEEIDGG